VTIADMQPLRDLAAEQARTTTAYGIASAAEDLLKLLRDQAQDDAIEERSSAAFDSVTSTVAGAPRDHELPGDRRAPGWWNLQPYSAFRIHGASQLAPLAPPRGFFFSTGLLA
jgi:hypothetical protein